MPSSQTESIHWPAWPSLRALQGKLLPTNRSMDCSMGLSTLNPGTYASMKRLIFEAQTLLSAELQNKVHKTEDQTKTKLAPAERESRVKEQKVRLEGLRLKGEEECAFQNYDLVLGMIEKDSLVYLSPEKFATRRSELALKKATKEILDQSALVVRDKAQDITCSTATELETTHAMRRRALAFDLVQACNYHVMNTFHAELFDHLHMVPPPGYSAVTLTQILRADRAAWLHMAEKLSTLKRDQQGNLPLEIEIAKVLAHPSVTFHLLPLPLRASSDRPSQPKAAATPKRTRSRTPPKANTSAPAKGKGKGKGGKSKRGRGPNIPRGLIGKCLHTKANKRLCWAFNLPQGCQDAKPGSKCGPRSSPLR